MRARQALPAVAVLLVTMVTGGGTAAGRPGDPQAYLVVAEETAHARALVASAGGQVLEEFPEIGALTAKADRAFPQRISGRADVVPLDGAAPIGRVESQKAPQTAPTAPAAPSVAGSGAEPYAHLQWGNQAVRATDDGSYRHELGDRRVAVGIMDTGIDATHPDIAPNFDRARSGTFTRVMPELDGPCPTPSCVNPPDADPLGHGTHVAGVVAAAKDGRGTAGVAPGVTLVSLRVAQDSGYVFPLPVVRALIHSGRVGLDVVNMAFVLDPWLFHCGDNPADSPAAQQEQRAIITVVHRAVQYARSRGVLPVASIGDQGFDLTKPVTDASSPTYPLDSAYPRTVDGSCQVLPAEADGVLAVSRLRNDLQLAPTSNFGLGATDVAAPGGAGGRGAPLTETVLSTYPESAARAYGMVNPDGSPNTPSLLRDCTAGTCAYYRYASIASPFAAGVAALVVSRHGARDSSGLVLDPNRTSRIVKATATAKACPAGPTTCEGAQQENGHYGAGIVDALGAVRGERR
jgi:hypothetical protein